MKKFVYFSIALAAAMLLTVSCSDDNGPDDNPDGPDVPSVEAASTAGLYVLNSGNWESNNAQLTYYDMQTKKVTTNVYEVANGKKLGDTANDMLVYGGKMYIAVSGSSIVFVTDLKGNLLGEVTVAGESANLSPRKLAKVEGKVYVSYMEGYVGAIDTANFNVNTVKVGPMPEGMAYANKKVYVANSDGYNAPYGTTVSVIDPVSFTVTKTIEVSNNPQTLHVASNNAVYLVCWGDYGQIPARLQKINAVTDAVTTIDGVYPTNMAIGKDGKAYILSSLYDENWNQTIEYSIYDTTKDRIVGEFVSTSDIPDGYSMFADAVTGNVYIGTSDYINNGDVYVVSEDGTILTSFDTGAMNPIAICTIRK